MKNILLILIFLFISACASGLSSVSEYNTAGHYAVDEERYEDAIKFYGESLKAASNDQGKATAMYGLGRANGFLCNFNESENWFLQAIEIQETLPDQPNRAIWLTQDYFELARLYYDNNNYSNAVVYFDKAEPLVYKLGADKSDPIGLANVLEDYADTLEKVGDLNKFDKITKKIIKLRKENPNKSADFVIKRFNKNCPQ